jgi:hypothetical protein
MNERKELARVLGTAAARYLGSLSSEQREKTQFGFPEDEARRDWAYFPRAHAGLPLHDMDRAQQKAAHGLISAGLGLMAYGKVTSIIGLESVLNLLEEGRMDVFRDPGRYFMSIFGEPGPDSWGCRIEGHHVCLNYTIVGGEVVSMTPNFLGANPASVRHGELDVVRPCAEEEDLGRELLSSLDEGQRAVAVLSEVAPPDLVLANAPTVPDACEPGAVGTAPQIGPRVEDMPDGARAAVAFKRGAPKGLVGREMTAGQRELLQRLVSAYVERQPDALARIGMDAVRSGLEGLHFAWAGGTERFQGHYYRVQGGSLLIEYDCTQDDANHVHAVLRDMERDFGDDALRRHLARDHASD